MIEQLIHRVKIRQAEIQMSLASGTPMNWESYQRIVGVYQGYEQVMEIINDMLEEEKGID
jgi:hypothetical protein